MWQLGILIGVLLVILIVVQLLKKPAATGARRGSRALPDSDSSLPAPAPTTLPAFQRRDYLLTAAERQFHDVLLALVAPRGYRLFVQTPLTCLVSLPPGVPDRQAWLNRIDRKTVDFVLCEPKALRPVLAIELDDSSHQRESRKQRDALVESNLAAAGVPLLRWKCDPRGYKREELAQAIAASLAGAEGTVPAPSATPSGKADRVTPPASSPQSPPPPAARAAARG
ncbi:MAG: DUF2726 domain-containing protein [Phycisphaerales bacterium]